MRKLGVCSNPEMLLGIKIMTLEGSLSLAWVKIMFHFAHFFIPLHIVQGVWIYSFGSDIPIELVIQHIFVNLQTTLLVNYHYSSIKSCCNLGDGSLAAYCD